MHQRYQFVADALLFFSKGVINAFRYLTAHAVDDSEDILVTVALDSALNSLESGLVVISELFKPVVHQGLVKDVLNDICVCNLGRPFLRLFLGNGVDVAFEPQLMLEASYKPSNVPEE